MLSLLTAYILKQESVSLVTNKMTAVLATRRIGLGSGGNSDDSNSCGNVVFVSPYNGDKNIKAMGYILVQWEQNSHNNTRNR